MKVSEQEVIFEYYLRASAGGTHLNHEIECVLYRMLEELGIDGDYNRWYETRGYKLEASWQ